jgi:hypothetical protein
MLGSVEQLNLFCKQRVAIILKSVINVMKHRDGISFATQCMIKQEYCKWNFFVKTLSVL